MVERHYCDECGCEMPDYNDRHEFEIKGTNISKYMHDTILRGEFCRGCFIEKVNLLIDTFGNKMSKIKKRGFLS